MIVHCGNMLLPFLECITRNNAVTAENVDFSFRRMETISAFCQNKS